MPKPRFVRIADVLDIAHRVKTGQVATRRQTLDMALAVLQLHAGYERQRAELVRTAPRGSRGPGEWIGFQSDDVPTYPTFVHHQPHVNVKPTMPRARAVPRKKRR